MGESASGDRAFQNRGFQGDHATSQGWLPLKSTGMSQEVARGEICICTEGSDGNEKDRQMRWQYQLREGQKVVDSTIPRSVTLGASHSCVLSFVHNTFYSLGYSA